jgi:hypothetical protein
VTARFSLAVLLCLLSLRAVRAEGSLLPNGHLDTSAVREAYLRSDIPFVKSALDAYLKSHPKDVSTPEKVFTHLYLGAAYAGDPEGRGKSEAHFRAALKFAPDADPVGLYLPPAALDWFESLRAEVRTAVRPAPSAPIPGTSSDMHTATATATASDTATVTPNILVPDAPPGGSSSPGAPPATGAAPALAADKPRGWIWWAVGGGAALAAGAGAFAWMETRSASPPQHVQVDATLK